MNDLAGGDRLVLPQWLSFSQASRLREHSVFPSDRRIRDLPPPASQELLDGVGRFRVDPQPFAASELMGLAVVMGENAIASEIARYVVTQPIVGTAALVQANQIIRPVCPDNPTGQMHASTLKAQLKTNPRDAIAWIEIARSYAVAGQIAKARNAVMVSLHLAPGNRHIVRAAIRFFVHVNDWEAALRVAERAYSINPDPLIYGPLLSIATHLDKLPGKIKPRLSEALRSEDRLLYSEILGAAGALELSHGADQRSRKFFKEAWMDPTRPVVGHSQWVLRERLPGLISEQHLDFRQSNEALGWLRQALLDFRGSVNACNEWSLEEPYARGAYILGSSSACLCGDFLYAENMAQLGLKANHGDIVLMNNLGFAQLHNGRLRAAEETLKPLERLLADESLVAPAATFGMLRMSQGRVQEGERLYAQAVDRALKAQNRPLAIRASLNYLFATLTVLKTLSVPFLSGATRALKECDDSGCIGVAGAIAKKLQRTDLQGSDEASVAAKDFIKTVEETRDAYMAKVKRRFHAELLQTEAVPRGTTPFTPMLAPDEGKLKVLVGEPWAVPWIG